MDEEEYEDEGSIDLMNAEEFSGLIVDLPNGGYFANIYRGVAYPGDPLGQRLQYGMSIPLHSLPPELHHQVVARESERTADLGPLVQVRGNIPPEVVPELGVERKVKNRVEVGRMAELKLVELRSRLDARNLTTDRLFLGRPLRLEFRGMLFGNMPSIRHMPVGYADKFKLMPTRVWITLQEDE